MLPQSLKIGYDTEYEMVMNNISPEGLEAGTPILQTFYLYGFAKQKICFLTRTEYML